MIARLSLYALSLVLAVPTALLAQPPLGNGQTHVGAIASPGEVDTWTFSAQQGSAVVLTAMQTGVPNLFRPRIRLMRPDNVELATDYGNEVARVVVKALPISGTYTVRIDSQFSGQTSPYALSLSLAPGAFTTPSGDQGGALANGVSHTGEITTADVDLWSFSATAGQQIFVSAGELSQDTTFSPWYLVVAPDGAIALERSAALVASGMFTASQTGSYTVLVSGLDKASTGLYRLTMVRVPDVVPTPGGDQGGGLTNGRNHAGTFQFGDIDVWTFEISSSRVVILSLWETLAQPNQIGALGPWIRIIGPDGALLTTTNISEDVDVSSAAQAAVAATMPGTYSVVVGGGGFGQYLLSMAALPSSFEVPAGDQGGALINGANHPGDVPGGDIDMWTFDAAAGETFILSAAEVFVTSAEARFQPSLLVWTPTGQILAQNRGTDVARVEAVTPLAGTYTVAVLDDSVLRGDPLGTYVLRLARAPGPQSAPAGDEGGLVSNGDHEGRLTLGDVDVWTFNATQGANLSVVMRRLETTYAPSVRLLRPDGVAFGAQARQDFDTDRLSVVAPVTGVYTVVAMAEHAVSTGGRYRLSVTGASVPVPTAVVTPSATNGTISPAAPQVVTVGATATFVLTPASGYQIGSVTSTCGGSLTGTVFMTGSVTADCSVAATFSLPVTLHTRYLAEGATSPFFDTRIALLNPGQAGTTATLRFLRAGTAPITHTVEVPAGRRVTVTPKMIPGLEHADFSTVVESSVPLVVDRTMTWDASGYGSHSETALEAPSPVWYFAEGATHSGFQLFYLLQNPTEHDVPVKVRYLLAQGAPIEKQYVIPAQSRYNIWVNVEEIDGRGKALASAELSAEVQTLDGTAIIAERAMYRNTNGRVFDAGHGSAGVARPSPTWYLAEGATGPFFDLYILIANPASTDAQVRLTYLLGDGRTFSRTLVAPANSRSGVRVDSEQFDGVPGFPLDDVAVSTTVESMNGVGLVVERAMWWPGDGSSWYEAHNSAGATSTGTRWAVAEGESGGPRQEETYILIANTSAVAGTARVTLYFEDGNSTSRDYVLPPSSRTNVAPAADFGDVVKDRRYGAVIEALGPSPVQLVVERAMYSNAGGLKWAAGSNALATRIE